MKYITLLVLPLLLTVSSCVKVLNDELKSEKIKLVVNGVLTPDSTLAVNISRTFNIFDDESVQNLPFVDDATVKFYQNGEYLFDLESQDTGYYVKNFYPQTGKKYFITVSATGYDDVSAETVVPDAVKIEKIDTSSTVYEEFGTKYLNLKADLTYNDPENEDNFYMLTGKYHLTNGSDINYEDVLDLMVPEGEAELFDKSYGALLWTDKFTNGQEVTVHFTYYQWYLMKAAGKDNLNVTFTFYLKSLSKDYYIYLKSLNLYNENFGDDPFMEPVIIHSNVKNGYGIFGAFNTDSIVIVRELIPGNLKEGGRP